MIIIQLTSEELSNLIQSAVRKALEEQSQTVDSNDTDRWFDLKELCMYHPDKPTKPTVYNWVNAGIIPVHKGGKKLRFLKSEIDNWLKQGRKKRWQKQPAKPNNIVKLKK